MNADKREKPHGPQNETTAQDKFDWYCFGLGYAVSGLLLVSMSCLFGG